MRRSPMRLGRPALGWMTTGSSPASGSICSRMSYRVLEPTEQLAPTAWMGNSRSARTTAAGARPKNVTAVIGECHLGHDRQVGQRADGQHRLLHLHGVGKGLHDEGVHPALEQPFRLLEEGGARLVRLHGAERRQVPAERPDGAEHEDVATHALADVPGQARPAPVDLAHARRPIRASRA